MSQGIFANLRRLALAVLLVLTAIATSAETHYRPRVSLGAKAGVALSRMSFSPSVMQGWNAAPQFALSVGYAEEKLFGLVAELGVTQRGWKENFEEHPFNYSRTLTYITLPVMTHIYFGPRRMKFFVNLGPEFSYMIGSSINANFDYLSPGSVPGFPIKNRQVQQLSLDVSNHFDYGITVGLGMEYFVKPAHSITFETRLYYGLGNIFPSSKADYFSASRNMTVGATLGYNFRLQ